MTPVDVAILLLLGFFLLKGLIRGLLKEICSLLGLVLGGVFAFSLHLSLAQQLQNSFELPAQFSVWGSFLAIFLIVVIVFEVVGFVLNRFVRLLFLGGFNRLCGALFGVVQGVVLVSMVVLALGSLSVPDPVRRQLGKSELAPPFVRLGQSIFNGSRDFVRR